MSVRKGRTKQGARRVARYDVRVGRDAVRRLLRMKSAVTPKTRRGDTAPWAGVVQPQPIPASLGLGLCDPAVLLNPEERIELERDVTRMIDGRRDAAASSESIRLS